MIMFDRYLLVSELRLDEAIGNKIKRYYAWNPSKFVFKSTADFCAWALEDPDRLGTIYGVGKLTKTKLLLAIEDFMSTLEVLAPKIPPVEKLILNNQAVIMSVLVAVCRSVLDDILFDLCKHRLNLQIDETVKLLKSEGQDVQD